MKIKDVKRFLNTDEITISCGGSIGQYQGKEVQEALERYGECTIIRITPAINSLDIEIKG